MICGTKDLAVGECASRVNDQPVVSYPYFINAGKYIYFSLSFRVRLVCRFNLCRSRCGGAPTFVHSDKSRQKRICGGVPPPCQNRKFLSTQSKFFPTRPPTAARRVLSYCHLSVNALFFVNPFLLPSACFCLRSPIHVGSLEGFNLSPAKRKRFTTFHIFSFADAGDCQEIRFMWFFGFVGFVF